MDGELTVVRVDEFELHLLRTALMLRVLLMERELKRRRREALLEETDPAMVALKMGIEEYSKLRERI